MEPLYHKTKQLILEISDCFQNLDKFKQSESDVNPVEKEIQEKIQLVKS